MSKEFVEIYDGDAIESVKTLKGNKVPFIKYEKFKKTIFGTQKEGFYDEYCGDYYGTAEDLLNGSYDDTKILVNDNIAYYRPRVKITFISGEAKYKHFDTIEECNKYAQGVMDKYVEKSKHFII